MAYSLRDYFQKTVQAYQVFEVLLAESLLAPCGPAAEIVGVRSL